MSMTPNNYSVKRMRFSNSSYSLHSPIYQEWLSILLENRGKGDSIPGASGVIGESGATAAALNALKTAAKIKCSPYQHYHYMLFVGDKLLALYSR